MTPQTSPAPNFDDLLPVLQQYFAFGVSATTARYHITPQYQALMQRRAEAEDALPNWKASLLALQNAVGKPVADDTMLHIDNGYRCRVFLRGGPTFTFREDGFYPDGASQILTVFVSVLAPVAYMTIEETVVVAADDITFLLPAELDAAGCQIVRSVATWLAERGIALLDSETASQPVAGLSLEHCEDDNVTLFDCLFSEFASSAKYPPTALLWQACLERV